MLVRQEKRALNIQVSFYGKSALLSYAKKAAKNPGAARLKNMNSSANNWRICVFLRVTPMAPEPSLRPKSRACARLAPARACGRRTAKLWRFSNAHETVRITFARSHAARVPENGIWNRGGPPRACRCRGNYFCAAAFPHARGAKCWPVCGPETPSRPARFPISFFDASVGCEHTNVILAVSCAFEKCHSSCRSEVRNHRSEAYKKMQICHSLAQKSAFFSRAEGAGFASGAPK